MENYYTIFVELTDLLFCTWVLPSLMIYIFYDKFYQNIERIQQNISIDFHLCATLPIKAWLIFTELLYLPRINYLNMI